MIFVIFKIEEEFSSKTLAKLYGENPIEQQLLLLLRDLQDEAADAMQIIWNQEYLKNKNNGKYHEPGKSVPANNGQRKARR